MKIEAEYEAKTLLSKEHYDQLMQHYPDALNHIEEQTNYYFDTADQQFKSQHSALRIRQIAQENVLTAKIRIQDYHQEVTLPLTDAQVGEILATGTLHLPDDFQQLLHSYGMVGHLACAKLCTHFHTKRAELKVGTLTLCFDAVTFKDHSDYEFEVEAQSSEQASYALRKILTTYDIPYIKSEPKIARALKTYTTP
ncbi:CYTH domain-containing protein [Allofustis seminis]|uniref:CYTH domain-containing protein n=1 Tax=Allofustis seminis TaxID=166939 RepID=UPI00037BABA3|nr:CYTH domain-containing protein [Allofustis seminis]